MNFASIVTQPQFYRLAITAMLFIGLIYKLVVARYLLFCILLLMLTFIALGSGFIVIKVVADKKIR